MSLLNSNSVWSSRWLLPLTAPVRLLLSRLTPVVPALSAQQLQWRSRGALLLTACGVVWLLWGLYAGERLSVLTVLGVLVPGAALAAAARRLLRQAGRLPRGAEDTLAPWIFAWTNAAQWSAVVLLALQLHRSHLDRYDASAIAATVALHVFVLAQLLRSWTLHVTAAALLVWIISALLIAPWHPAALTAFGTGVILWLLTPVILVPLGLSLQLGAARASPAGARCHAASRWGRPAPASTQVIVIPHSGAPGARARQKAAAVHSRRLEDEKEKMYAELVAQTMPAIARQSWPAAPASQHSADPEMQREAVRRSRAAGRQQALSELVLRLLTIRFRELSADLSTCIEVASEEELVAVAERVLAAATLQQALGERLAARSEALTASKAG